jgi:hypothetical protein
MNIHDLNKNISVHIKPTNLPKASFILRVRVSTTTMIEISSQLRGSSDSKNSI